MKTNLLANLLCLTFIVVSCSDKPVEPINAPPVITSFSADSTILSVNSQTRVECIAHDADSDSLIYEWISYPGSVLGDGAEVIWQSPEVGATFPLLCRVRDEYGGVTEASIAFSVLGNKSPIYQIILEDLQKNWYPDNQIFIIDSTLYDGASPFYDRHNLNYSNPDLLHSTYENYKVVNRLPDKFSDYPYWNADKIFLLPYSTITEYFSEKEYWMMNCAGWNNFKSDNPDSRAIIRLSKAGFNHERNQALVYMETLYKAYGYGYFYLLSKTNSGWQIVDSSGLWHVDYLCFDFENF